MVAVVALLAVRLFVAKSAFGKAWIASALTIVATVFFGVAGLYPVLLPSSLNPAYSLTAFNSASSPLTLKIMLGVALVMVPVVIAYQGWMYFMFRGKVEADLESEEAY